MSSSNEWDMLREVIVGEAHHAAFPSNDPVFNCQKETTLWKETVLPSGRFPYEVRKTATIALDELASFFISLGIKVHRPEIHVNTPSMSHRDGWECDSMYNYCPRDLLLVVDDLVIEAPMTYRSRWNEPMYYEGIKQRIAKGGIMDWISAPKPRLRDGDFEVVDGHLKLTEDYPIFDAANVCRVNDDLLYLVSETGNYRGGEWLQETLPHKTVHIIDNLYSYAHIDSTICPLQEGLVMLNGNRVNDTNCPKVFKDWEKIYIQENEVVAQYFYEYPYASKWIALNLLVIHPGHVIMEKGQPLIRKRLEEHNIEVVEIEWTMARTLGGGLHCCTLDLHRA